jgi:hypothetical protein
MTETRTKPNNHNNSTTVGNWRPTLASVSKGLSPEDRAVHERETFGMMMRGGKHLAGILRIKEEKTFRDTDK